MIADRVKRIEMSPTLRISATARAMKAAGIDVIDFSVGEPDFPTPENIKDAARKAIGEDFTKYTENDGIPALKDAIINKLRNDNGVEYKPADIIVSSGAKHSLYNLFLALVNKDEEVIVPAPYWVSYPEMVSLAKGKAVIVRTTEETGFKLTPEMLKKYVNFNTKALVINNPSNPTGAGYSREELEEIAELAVKEGIFIVSDEIYEKIVYDDFRFTCTSSISEEVKRQTILVNGVSKAYSMTGWRIGYAAGPKEIIQGMGKIQSHSTSNPSSISQKASLEALAGPQHEIGKMVREFEKRRNYLLQKLAQIRGISCYKPQGAFYLFPNVSNYYDTEFKGTRIRNGFGLSYYLLKEAKVAVVPGDAFGAPENIRISYATSMENLEKGIQRIIEAFERLRESPKGVAVRINNSFTTSPKDKARASMLTTENRDTMVRVAESFLPYDSYMEWNANINGTVLQLRTNVPHLYEFWMENFYPALIESEIEPHGVIYAVTGIPGKDTASYYHPETKTGVVVNSSYYGHCRNLALGMAAELTDRLLGIHSVRASCLDYDGQGILLIVPKGTNKTEHFYRLLEWDKINFHSAEWIQVRYRENRAVADTVERKAYIPSYIVKIYPRLKPLFDKCKSENIVENKKQCTDLECQQKECAIDHGEPFCYWASKDSRVIIDPVWLVGSKRYKRRTNIKWIFVLLKEAMMDPVSRLTPDDAVDILSRSGMHGIGSGTDDSARNAPFFNPYLLNMSDERRELQKLYFRKLFSSARGFVINSGHGTMDDVQNRIRAIIRGESGF